ncbi:MAG TPA: energy-coupling factor transporter transmembrane component T [Candidatus Deferrimicrobium sp.]|nr:energy-coupling factor transporter transmembrane component T [Candidatus Deferrimicrobium sp.]
MSAPRPILMGQYRPLHSFLHRLDVRAKIVPVTLVLVLSLLTDASLFYVAVLAVLVFGLLFSGVAPVTLARNFKPILLLVAITALYHFLFSGRDSRTVVQLFGLKVTAAGVSTAVYYSLRLALFVAVAFLVTLTSSPSDLADAFSKILRPLRRLRVPVDDISLILFMAIRFIPVLYEEFTTIRNAQIVRGVRFSGSWYNRIRRSVYLILPVFLAALQRADELALAIQVRGYGRSASRTHYTGSHIGIRELLFLTATTSLILAAFFMLG